MKNPTTNTANLQFVSTTSRLDLLGDYFFNVMQIPCDECALPLSLYGSNFIESYTAGQANVLRALCDRHAAEMGGAE
jgi:hypothetical protein